MESQDTIEDQIVTELNAHKKHANFSEVITQAELHLQRFDYNDPVVVELINVIRQVMYHFAMQEIIAIPRKSAKSFAPENFAIKHNTVTRHVSVRCGSFPE